jgi:hypothetical protein
MSAPSVKVLVECSALGVVSLGPVFHVPAKRLGIRLISFV